MHSPRGWTDVFRAQGLFVVPGFLGTPERSELRRACDAALERQRARSRETGHTTPHISLIGDGGFEDDPRAFELIAAFVGSARGCALLERWTGAGKGRVSTLVRG